MLDLRDSLRDYGLEPLRHIVRGDESRFSVAETVRRVIELRSGRLKREQELDQKPWRPTKPFGRLLAVLPGISLSHGFSYDETGGFIDRHEIPPWDSWVTYFEHDGVLVTGATSVGLGGAMRNRLQRRGKPFVGHESVRQADCGVEREGSAFLKLNRPPVQALLPFYPTYGPTRCDDSVAGTERRTSGSGSDRGPSHVKP